MWSTDLLGVVLMFFCLTGQCIILHVAFATASYATIIHKTNWICVSQAEVHPLISENSGLRRKWSVEMKV